MKSEGVDWLSAASGIGWRDGNHGALTCHPTGVYK
jgi:hypothetical protein